MENIIVQLRKMMDERGWSEYRLAKEASLPQSTVANIFHRNTLPSIPTLKTICDAFGLSLGEFFTELEQCMSTDTQTAFLRKWRKLSKTQQAAVDGIMKELISGGNSMP